MISTFSHLLMAVFTIISIPLIIPIFHFLFSTQPDQQEKPDSIFDIIEWLQYYFLQMINAFGSERTLVYSCLFILVAIFLKNLFRYLALYIMAPVRSNVVRDLRSELYQNIMALSFDAGQKQRRGDLITRISSDVQEIEWNMLRFVDTIIKSPIIIIGAVLLMLSISVKLSLFVVVLMLFTALVIGTLSKKLKRQSSDLQARLSDINTSIDENLDGSLFIRIYGVARKWKEKFEDHNSAYKTKFDKVTRRQELSSPLSEFLGVAVVVILLWFGATLVMADELRAETFFAFVLAFYHVIEPLKSFSTAYYYLKRGSASLDRILALSQNGKITVQDQGKTDIQFGQEISFENVSYAYDENTVLNGLNLRVKKGEKVAIVGPSGAGKSTLVRLLLKLIGPQEGQITIDNQPLNEISTESLYKQIGYVSQNPFLYQDTIRNNITLGREGIHDDLIWNALKLACADTFVANLNKGLDTLVGERGDLLSGGEKQRLTIARALVHNPSILIFDEPTSALDPESEKQVSQAIINVLEDRTAVVIAHRLSTIKFADKICVMEKGKIVEEGSHADLAAQKGLYANFVSFQSIESSE